MLLFVPSVLFHIYISHTIPSPPSLWLPLTLDNGFTFFRSFCSRLAFTADGLTHVSTNTVIIGSSLELLDQIELAAPDAAQPTYTGSQHRSKRRKISRGEERLKKADDFFEDAIPLGQIEIDLVCQAQQTIECV